MPKVGLGGETMIGYSPEQIKELIGDGDMGLCLDFGHTVKAAVSRGVDYKVYVKGFIGLEPRFFHASDEHLGIGEGEYDLGFLMGCVKEMSANRLVTVETPRFNSNSLADDAHNCKYLKTLIFQLSNIKDKI